MEQYESYSAAVAALLESAKTGKLKELGWTVTHEAPVGVTVSRVVATDRNGLSGGTASYQVTVRHAERFESGWAAWGYRAPTVSGNALGRALAALAEENGEVR